MFLLTVFAEELNNPYAAAYVRFKRDDDEWFLRGRFMGHDRKGGYISIPVNGKTERLYHLDDVGDIFTKNFEKMKRGETQLKIIWDWLVREDFHRDEKPEFLEKNEPYLI
jgi:hypothetical protein